MGANRECVLDEGVFFTDGGGVHQVVISSIGPACSRRPRDAAGTDVIATGVLWLVCDSSVGRSAHSNLVHRRSPDARAVTKKFGARVKLTLSASPWRTGVSMRT